MKTVKLEVTRIGRSCGIRIPVDIIQRYGITDSVILEQRRDGVFLRAAARAVEKLSWAATAREMAREHGCWNDWDTAIADGLGNRPWENGISR